MADEVLGSQPAEPKFSRYRSVRRANNEASTSPEGQPQEETGQDSINRSRSRYHRQQQPAQSETTQSKPLQSQRAQAAALSNGSISRTTGRSAPLQDTTAGAHDQRAGKVVETEQIQRPAYEDGSTRRRHHTGPTDRATVSSQEELKKVVSRQSPRKKHTDNSRPDSSRVQRQKSFEARRASIESEEGEASCFGMFKRKRDQELPIRTEKPPMRQESTQKTDGSAFIKQGGGGIVPGTDAPKSAVNAGDRVGRHSKIDVLRLTESSARSGRMSKVFHSTSR